MSEDRNTLVNYSAYRPPEYPVRHVRKIPFDPVLRVCPGYRETVQRIRGFDNLLGEMVLSGRDYLDLVSKAYASNIYWSVKMGGNELPSRDVRRMIVMLASKKRKKEPEGGPQQEAVNHLRLCLSKTMFRTPWSIDTIKDVHSALLGNTGAECPLGTFRTEPVSVVGSDGFEYFVTCPPENINEELDSLLKWLTVSPYDEVITASLFFHEFESIYPFMDGNGRTGRILFHMLLRGSGLKNSKLCRIEQRLLDPPETYYALLAYADATGDYGPLVMYVAESLLSAYEEAFALFRKKDLAKGLDAISKTIIKRAKKERQFTLTDACGWIPGSCEQTVRNRVNDLIGIGLLTKTGNTRATAYSFRDPFRDIADEGAERSR